MTFSESLERRTLLSLTAGDLDPSFGQGGIFVPVGNSGDEHVISYASTLAVQGDGMILVASQVGLAGSRDFVLTRYDAGGRPDPNFGMAGNVVTDFGGDDSPSAMVVQPDGRVLVVGRNDNSFAAVRYSALDGSLDEEFGKGGRMTLADVGPARAITLDGSGRILVASATGGPSSLFRLNSNGSLDESFNAGEPAGSYLIGIGIGPGGQIVAGGLLEAPGAEPDHSSEQYFILRRFGGRGKLISSQSLHFDYDVGQVSGFHLFPDGSVIMSGTSIDGATCVIGRFSADGKSAVLSHPTLLPTESFRSHKMLVQTDGKIILAGSIRSHKPKGWDDDWALIRLLPDGSSVDATFGSQGVAVTVLSDDDEQAMDVAWTPDGNILALGTKDGSGLALGRFYAKPPLPTPFHGVPFQIGQQIQAEDFDQDGEGESWHDSDVLNSGNFYRNTGVDILRMRKGRVVSWIEKGEWLNYSIQVPKSGQYTIDTRLMSKKGGLIRYFIDGKEVKARTIIPKGGAGPAFRRLRSGALHLPVGPHVLRVSFTNVGAGSDISIDRFQINPART